jgi:hypothetical protein
MGLKDMINNIYFDKKDLKRTDYVNGRKLFNYEGCAAMGIFSITSGAFLAGLAQHMGASDEFNGIIGAIPALAGVVQIFSSLVFEKLERRKFLISIMCFCFRFLLGLMFLIPFIIENPNYRLAALAGFYGTAYVLASFISPPAANWIVELTPENIRGKYFAVKDAYSLAFVTVITLIMGKVLDIYKNNNSINTGYAIIGVVVIILTIINFIFISSVKEPLTKKIQGDLKIRDVILNPIKNKNFRKILILFILWNVGLQIAGPFFSVYMVTKLQLSYTYIMIMGVIASLVRVIIVVYWGKFADSRSWISCAKYSIAVLAVCTGLWTIVDKNTMIVLIPLLHIMGGIAWAGINISLFNIQFVFAPKEGRTMYLGLNAAIGGTLGFLSTVSGSLLLKLLGNFKIDLFLITISSIQVLFALSGIILLISVLYIHLFIKEIKRG